MTSARHEGDDAILTRADEYVESIRKLVEEYEQGADYSLEREHASTQLEALAPSIARAFIDLADRLKGLDQMTKGKR